MSAPSRQDRSLGSMRKAPRRRPRIPSNRCGQVAEWLKAADCKSARASVRWFESSPVHHPPFSQHLRKAPAFPTLRRLGMVSRNVRTKTGELTAVAVKAAMVKPGTYQDGDGLFLRVGKTGAASRLGRLQRTCCLQARAPSGMRPIYGCGSGLRTVPGSPRSHSSRSRSQSARLAAATYVLRRNASRAASPSSAVRTAS